MVIMTIKIIIIIEINIREWYDMSEKCLKDHYCTIILNNSNDYPFGKNKCV